MKRNIVLFSAILLAFLSMGEVFAESTTYYVVQVGYYKNKVIMEKDFNIIAGHGLPVYKVAHDGGYRLYLGNYSSREEAETVAETVKELGYGALIRTMEKKPQSIPNTSPDKTVEKATNKTTEKTAEKPTDKIADETIAKTAENTSDKTTDTIDKSPENMAQDMEKQNAQNKATTSSADKIRSTLPESNKPDQLNEIQATGKNHAKVIHSMFYATLIVILLIGTLSAGKRNMAK